MSSNYTDFVLATIAIKLKTQTSESQQRDKIVSKLRITQVLHSMSGALLDSVNLKTRL